MSKKNNLLFSLIGSTVLIFVLNLFIFPSAVQAATNYQINAGGTAYTDSTGLVWQADSNVTGGYPVDTTVAVTGTPDPFLYKSERFGNSTYTFNSLTNGNYNVTLKFAEIYWSQPNQRVFNVSINGVSVLTNFDILTQTTVKKALDKSFPVTVTSGTIKIIFTSIKDQAKISAIKIAPVALATPSPTPKPTVTPTPTPTPTPSPSPTPIAGVVRINAGGPPYVDQAQKSWMADQNFTGGTVGSTTAVIAGTSNQTLYKTERYGDFSYTFNVTPQTYTVNLKFAEIYATQNDQRIFNVDINGSRVLDKLDIFKEVGANTALDKTFSIPVTGNTLTITFSSVANYAKISAIEIFGESFNPAHVVPPAPQTKIDTFSVGSVPVTLDGTGSHTHAPGQSIASYKWIEGTTQIGTGSILNTNLGIGFHTISLVITDTAGNINDAQTMVNVLTAAKAPGLMGYYYNFSQTPLTAIPDLNNLTPDYAQFEPYLNTPTSSGVPFRGSPYSANFAARYKGLINIAQAGTYYFAIESNDGSKLYIDGNLLVDNDGLHEAVSKYAGLNLSVGQHQVQIDYFQQNYNQTLNFYWNPLGQGGAFVPASVLTHDHSQLVPVINSLSPTTGVLMGGNKVTVSGFGFIYPTTQTQVKIGTQTLTGASLNILNEKTIEFTTPAGSGTVPVTVTTPKGTSKPQNFVYSDTAPPPVNFNVSTISTLITAPTALAFGPDKKLYVGTQNGEVWILTLDSNLQITSSVKTTPLTSEGGPRAILGLNFNPFDDPATPKVYVSHSTIYDSDGPFTNGKVSLLSGVNLSSKTDLVTGLPVSALDHSVNGLEFGPNGEMYIQVGGFTNAGVPAPFFSNIDEIALSGAALVAHIEKGASFQGNITYDAQGNQIGGLDVSIFAAGERNPFNLVMHSNGKLYGTDNGPNPDEGAPSTSCTTSGPNVNANDELNILQAGTYLGHPNRFRGKTDPRQCIYHNGTEASNNGYTGPLTTFPSSVDGIMEYRATNFGGQLKNHLITSRFLGGGLYDVALSADGLTALSNKQIAVDGALNIAADSRGNIFGVDVINNKVVVFVPVETVSTSPRVISTFPVRVPLAGNRVITVSGNNFAANSTVKIGDNNCPVSSVTATEIVCTSPASSSAGTFDISVNSNGIDATASAIFTYMAK